MIVIIDIVEYVIFPNNSLTIYKQFINFIKFGLQNPKQILIK
jgi:hypothetical protein